MKRMATLLLVAGVVLFTTGCDKVSKSFVAEDSCSSETAKKTMREIFVGAVEESARRENKGNAGDASLPRFDLAKIRATMDGVGLQLDDVITTKKDPNSSKKFCEAQLTFVMPEKVLDDANALRNEVGENSTQNMAEDEGFRVDLNKFSSKISYSVQPTDSGDKLYTEIEGADKFSNFLALTVKYAALKVLRTSSQGDSTGKAQEQLAQEQREREQAEEQRKVLAEAQQQSAQVPAVAAATVDAMAVGGSEAEKLAALGKTAPGSLLRLPKNSNLRAGPNASQPLVAQIQMGSQLRVLKDKAIRVEDDGTETPWLAVELAEGQFCSPGDIGARAECVSWSAGHPISGWISSKAFIVR